jgi:ABC-type antimicrobial peptide transport system permease subunit
MSYDRFHENLDNIHLVGTHHKYGAREEWTRQSPPALGPALAAEFPEVLRSTRFNYSGSRFLRFGDLEFAEHVHHADQGFFEIFSFRFLEGNPATAFSDRNSLVMTESTARKYFGDEPAVGKSVLMDYKWSMKVTGVVADVPTNSTLRFRILMPFEFTGSLPGRERYLKTWYNCSFSTYVQLHPSADIDALGAKIAGRVKESDPDTNLTAFLFPFADLNLYSVSGPGGFIVTLIMFSINALVILLIACVNFMNLATARAGDRAKEIGVRKVAGATRGELVTQFYMESLLQALLALVLALVIVEHFLPRMRELLPWADLRLDLGDPVLLAGSLGIALLAGLLAGSYPALVLSSFEPAVVFKGRALADAKGVLIRRVLVVAQFGATIVLLICTTVVYRQFEYLEQKPVGYNRENLLYLQMDETMRRNFTAFKGDLLSNPAVVGVAKASRSLAGIYTNGHGWEWEGRDPNVNPLVTYLGVGLDYETVMGIELAEGRFFAERDIGRRGVDVVINETFARLLGEGSAIGKTIRHDDHDDPAVTNYNVIGVVKDFHYKPLYNAIGPLLVELDNERSNNRVFVKTSGADTRGALDHIEQVFHKHNPDKMFNPIFVDDEYEGLYRGVQRRGDILKYFALVAIVVSCLGLYGLASFMTQQRSKEIGIRKVLGASVSGVVYMLTVEFVRWVVVANLIAWPIAYILARGHMEGFSYQVGIGPSVFLVVGLFSVVLALLAVSVQSVRAALADPVEAIRNE